LQIVQYLWNSKRGMHSAALVVCSKYTKSCKL